jgi:demethylmenaquinone methyltransferase/2-methoxy-6-polyprenyl-1,4-benzoquinol methylase
MELTDVRRLLTGQIDYYQAMAATGRFDRAYARTGEYARESATTEQWNAELRSIEAALDRMSDVDLAVELACGSGRWTPVIARHARRVLAVDAAPHMLDINRARTLCLNVEHVLGDAFTWAPDRPADLVVMCLWLSHVPPSLFDGFWSHVLSWMSPDSSVFVMDSLPHPDRVANDEAPPASGSPVHVRSLPDGRRVSIPKVFYRQGELESRLDRLGFDVALDWSGQFFFFGTLSRRCRVAEAPTAQAQRVTGG